MAKGDRKDYEHIDTSYDQNMERSKNGVTGAAEASQVSYDEKERDGREYGGAIVKTGLELKDLWIRNFIKSRTFSPGVRGFYLDGDSGEAEFAKILVRSRSNWPAIDVRKWEGDGTGVFVRSDAGSSVEIEQRSNTVGLRVTSTNLSSVNGSVIDVINEAGDGSGLGIQQRGTGVVAYLEKEDPETGETAFYPITLMSGGDYSNLVKTWVGDGANPNENLSATVGDVLYSKDGKTYKCRGSNTWTHGNTFWMGGMNTSQASISNDTGEGVLSTYWLNGNANNLSDGSVVKVRMMGECDKNSVGPVNMTIRLKIDGTTYVTSVSTLTGPFTDYLFNLTYEIAVVTTGASGRAYISGFGNFGHWPMTMVKTASASSIDLSGTPKIEVSAQWGAAHVGNSITKTAGWAELNH